ncbi:ferredoxin [Williamsia sp. CHRR-6]|uniref:ferredoxin n=1 Tax=Williamsia sp. CHRR-6 TaxID=2835871 RepID=UPI001BD94D4D|nr:ferredoxin [Williamsia sp. CHRR-6]MBT0567332.1 ferredoxin [Williamsia sp. CHRR-6]
MTRNRSHAPRLHIDWTRCDGRGSCTELLPHTLDRDEWGYPMARTGEREPTVAESDRRHVNRAVKACPLLALRVVD